MKSKALLKSFTYYCEQNPQLRFWQALCSWSGAKAIYKLLEGTHLQVMEQMRTKDVVLKDTFYEE